MSRQTIAPEAVIADAMSEHFHFCDEPRMADCGECTRVIATATRVYKALVAAGLLPVVTSDDAQARLRVLLSDDASSQTPGHPDV